MKKLLIMLTFIGLMFTAGFAQTIDRQKDHRTYLQKVSKLLNEGNQDEALNLLAEAIVIFPNESLLYFRRAEIHRNQKKFELVEVDVNKAVSVSKDKYNTYLYAGSLLMQIRKCESALAIITQAVNLEPLKTNGYFSRAAVQGSCLNNKAAALNDINYLLSLDPQHTQARSFKNRLLAEIGNTKPNSETDAELIKSLEQKLQKSPEGSSTKRELAMLYVNRARMFEKEKEIEKMFGDYDRAVKIYPTGSFYKLRGKALFRHKHYEEAIRDFTRALEKQPGFWTLYLYMGDIYVKQQQYQKAIDTYKKALKIRLASEKRINDRIKRTEQMIISKNEN